MEWGGEGGGGGGGGGGVGGGAPDLGLRAGGGDTPRLARRRGRVVRQRIANPCIPVRFWTAPPSSCVPLGTRRRAIRPRCAALVRGPPDPARMTLAHPRGPSDTHVPHVWDEQVEEQSGAGTRGGTGGRVPLDSPARDPVRGPPPGTEVASCSLMRGFTSRRNAPRTQRGGGAALRCATASSPLSSRERTRGEHTTTRSTFEVSRP